MNFKMDQVDGRMNTGTKAGTNTRAMIELQPRDCALIDLIYEHQFISTLEVERYLFKDVEPRIARRRVLLLERAGVIRREKNLTFGLRPILRLTRAGRTIVETRRPFFVKQRTRIDLRTLMHERAVLCARLRLSELWDGQFIPEAALKQEDYPQLPDGVFVFKSGAQIALEVENSLKGPARFHEIQARWQGVKVRAVLYVATNQHIFENVKRYLETGSRSAPFALTTIQNLEQPKPSPAFTALGHADLFSKRVIT